MNYKVLTMPELATFTVNNGCEFYLFQTPEGKLKFNISITQFQK